MLIKITYNPLIGPRRAEPSQAERSQTERQKRNYFIAFFIMTKIANRAQIFVPGLSALAQRIAVALDHLRGRLSCDRIPAPNISPMSEYALVGLLFSRRGGQLGIVDSRESP